AAHGLQENLLTTKSGQTHSNCIIDIAAHRNIVDHDVDGRMTTDAGIAANRGDAVDRSWLQAMADDGMSSLMHRDTSSNARWPSIGWRHLIEEILQRHCPVMLTGDTASRLNPAGNR